MNSESQGVVKDFHVFPKGGFPPGDDLQTITVTELADPPEKIASQEILYVSDLLFPALGTEYFSYDLHAASSLGLAEKKYFLLLILGQAESNVNQIFPVDICAIAGAVREPPQRQVWRR